MTNPKKIVQNFKNKKIMVIGDIVLDRYIFGEVKRISPEAPIPIIEVKKESFVLGGAANAANNIASLGANAILIGTIGKDLFGKITKRLLKNSKIESKFLVETTTKHTFLKERIIAQNQQLLRIDREDESYITQYQEKELLSTIKSQIVNVDAVIISDYAKGTISKNLIQNIIDLSNKNKKTVVVDPRLKHTQFYKNATIIKPNQKEALTMADLKEEDSLITAGKILVKKLNSNIIITKGQDGMSLFSKDKTILHIPTFAKQVYDVSGAGDTVTAALTLALTAGASLKDAMIISNHAAGVVVSKFGTATVSTKELLDNFSEK